MIWKKTFNFFGKPFTFSISRIKSVGDQIFHFCVHFAVAMADPSLSLGGALFIEVRDGEQGHLEPHKEGFNIFADFVFRIAGVLVAIPVRDILQINWRIF